MTRPSSAVLSRRSFMQGLFGTFALGAGGCAGLSFDPRPRRDPTLVALLSDCHAGDWHSTPYQGEKLKECVARILALDPLPSKMLITGDLAYLWGRKEDYALSRRLLQPVIDVGIEVTIGMGNHDRRENFLEFWPEYAKRTPVPGRIVSEVRGTHFDYIMIDTLDQPKETDRWITPGRLEGEQREWLKGACAAAKRPFLVLAHHPAIELGGEGTKPSRQSAAAFGELVMGTKEAPTKCCGYIHGHDHAWYVTRLLSSWKGNRIGQTLALPSTGHWGDIGYSLLREYPDRAEVSLVQYDFFTPKPLPAGTPPRADWQAIVRDHANLKCTFVAS